MKTLRDNLFNMTALIINHSLHTAPEGIATIENEVLIQFVSCCSSFRWVILGCEVMLVESSNVSSNGLQLWQNFVSHDLIINFSIYFFTRIEKMKRHLFSQRRRQLQKQWFRLSVWFWTWLLLQKLPCNTDCYGSLKKY